MSSIDIWWRYLVKKTKTPTTGRGRRRPRTLFLVGALVLLVPCAVVLLSLRQFLQSGFDPSPSVNQVALADLNGDGHLDAFLAVGHGSAPYPAYALSNDGTGRFADGALPLDRWTGFSVALGDLNGDHRPEALLDISGGGVVLYRNRGDGTFRRDIDLPDAGPGPIAVMRFRPALGDLNGDGRQDVLAAGCCGRGLGETPDSPLTEPLFPYSQVWLNAGGGQLATAQRLGQVGSNAVALDDLNGDGSLDAFLANGRTIVAPGEWPWKFHPDTPNTVWLNDGQGNFRDSGQQLGRVESLAVALGDLNGDGSPDAVVGNRGSDEVWFNDGRGNFSDSGQRLENEPTYYVYLADLNSDGSLDVFVSGDTVGRVWFNDGAGHFTPARQRIRYGHDETVALGDVTGDGLVDVFVAGVASYQVWRGEGNGRFTADVRADYR
jgi:hypothetical protein